MEITRQFNVNEPHRYDWSQNIYQFKEKRLDVGNGQVEQRRRY